MQPPDDAKRALVQGALAELAPEQFFFWYHATGAGADALSVTPPTVAFKQYRVAVGLPVPPVATCASTEAS